MYKYVAICYRYYTNIFFGRNLQYEIAESSQVPKNKNKYLVGKKKILTKMLGRAYY